MKRLYVKKLLSVALILLVAVSLFGCSGETPPADPGQQPPSQEAAPQTDEAVRETVANLVKDFGGRLQNVSLLAPKDTLIKSIQDNYGQYVSPDLLNEWQKDPQNAPGRVTSSPWPDRIEVLSVVKLPDSSYEVKGEVIEVTSTEKANGGAAARRPVTLAVGKIGDRWLITAVRLGAYKDATDIVYQNTQYGFNFSLPQSWRGYTIVTDKWEGLPIGGSNPVATGPLLSIRHPRWTSQKPRQDIPIMVFTLDQWNSLQREEFHIGAAPIGPKELGRNSRYVFALPARYNFAFPTGFEEVEKILEGGSLQTNENFSNQ
ncbi:MAG: hypothetical protein HPY50_16595 [Firmicutes bacterium]|nr:hypothetical protein [Bacillota bacterium]